MSATLLTELANDVTDIERRAKESFGNLGPDQLNWCPGPDRWSIAQCLEHLVKANEPYFAIFDEAARGTHRATFWERVPILPRLWGAALLNTVHPDTARKARAPKIFRPVTSSVPPDIVARFLDQQPRLLEAMRRLEAVDLAGTIVTSPVASFITYSLRDTLLIVVYHEERHMRQAERVLKALPDGA